jgi:hypothetical protein
MSRKSNVNPDHYKTAGRERPGQDIVQEVHKQKYMQDQEAFPAEEPEGKGKGRSQPAKQKNRVKATAGKFAIHEGDN